MSETGAYEHLRVERRGRVGWLILDRPEVYNAMNNAMLAELPRAWAELRDDPEVFVIVTAAVGKGFCTGVDMSETAGSDDGMAVHEARVRSGKLGLTALHNEVWKPVICAVNGVCAGGGLHFVVDADIVICASDSTFLDPHVSVGQVSIWEPIGLRVRIPFEAAARMLFVGRHERMNAERAHQLGLVSQVVDPPESLWDEAQALAEKIALNSPSAMMASKKALWESLDSGLNDSLLRGGKLLAEFWNHPDNLEGPLAFTEKRPAVWAPPTTEL